jgi:hypothetical protein
MGPNREFVALGRQQIEEWALGAHMEGFEKWRYPYDKILIDEQQGRSSASGGRSPRSSAMMAAITKSRDWAEAGSGYGGTINGPGRRDFFDLGNVKSLFMELAADGKLEPPVKQKLRRLAWGLKLPGVDPIHRRSQPRLPAQGPAWP